MNIYLRDNYGDIVIKDILTINFDMSVEYDKERAKYQVRVNRNYTLKDEFATKEEAEEAMIQEAWRRDKLEADILNET
ncbi:MAG: hypothetical protein E7302_13380 [Butyrivibrio sp.]|nr:hypothetical protein [Butyrivibrio sp.]